MLVSFLIACHSVLQFFRHLVIRKNVDKRRGVPVNVLSDLSFCEKCSDMECLFGGLSERVY